MWEEGKHATSIVWHRQFLPFSCTRHLFPTSATALSTAPAFSGNKTKINFMSGAALLKTQRNCLVVFWKQHNRKSCDTSCLGDQRGIRCHARCVTASIQQNHRQTLTFNLSLNILSCCPCCTLQFLFVATCITWCT